MKKSALVVSFIVAVLLVLGVYFFNSAKPMGAGPDEPRAPISHKEDPNRPSPPLNAEESAKAQTALKQMTQVLFDFTVQEKSLSDLMDILKNGQHEPFQVSDKNPDTGEMIIVRTKSPLPGTRYFHAQYFVDDGDQPFAQHISFEYRPSPEAMEQAIAMVRATFPGLGAPMHESRDFIQWELPHGYVIWVKRLDQQDISNNPFNAYTQGDIGSVRVAVEMNPESDGGHTH